MWGSALFSHASIGVNLLGGTRPHIGAVAVAIPRARTGRGRRWSATTSVFAVVGHKDDEVARPVAAALARELRVTVVVTAGGPPSQKMIGSDSAKVMIPESG